MADEYDTNAFMIFVIAILGIYILCASIFLFKRIRRAVKKEPISVSFVAYFLMNRRKPRRLNLLKSKKKL